MSTELINNDINRLGSTITKENKFFLHWRFREGRKATQLIIHISICQLVDFLCNFILKCCNFLPWVRLLKKVTDRILRLYCTLC